MPEYRYECVDVSGRRISGRLRAETRDIAVEELRRQGYIPTSVLESGEGRQRSQYAPGFGGVSVNRLAIFTRKLATLVRTDIRLSETFEILADEEEGYLLPEAARHVADQVSRGVPLGEAMAQRPQVFSRLYIKMVEAGINSGNLDYVADNLAQLYENENALRKRIIGKLVYPAILLILSMLISLILRSFGMITTELFNMLLVIWAVVIGLVLLGRTRIGYSIYRQIGFRLPWIGDVMRKINLARFCRIFSLQFSAGVPMIESLETSKDVLQDPDLSKAIDHIKFRINEGSDLKDAMVSTGKFPRRMIAMVGTGEKAGGVEEMLDKLAEYYDLEIDSAAHAMTTIIYFVVYLGVALTVAIIVISSYQSYFGMISSLINDA